MRNDFQLCCGQTGLLRRNNHPPSEAPSLAGCWLTDSSQSEAALQRDFVQTDVLDGGPDNRQTTGLRGEDVDLISALAHEAPKTFNGVGRLNMAVSARLHYGSRPRRKRTAQILAIQPPLSTDETQSL